MGKKMGRPTVPKREAKTNLRGAMFAQDEAKTIDRDAEQSGKSKSEWIRGRLLGPTGNQPIPVICPDVMKYQGKPAVLYLEINGEQQRVDGKFRAWLDPDCLSVVVYVSQQGESYQQFFHLPQVAVDSIRPLPTTAGTWEVQEPLVLLPMY